MVRLTFIKPSPYLKFRIHKDLSDMFFERTISSNTTAFLYGLPEFHGNGILTLPKNVEWKEIDFFDIERNQEIIFVNCPRELLKLEIMISVN